MRGAEVTASCLQKHHATDLNLSFLPSSHLRLGDATRLSISVSQCLSDLNGNQTVDNDDLLILLAQYGVYCSDIPWLDPVISEIH